jgi:hypothetical protein
MLRLFLPEKKQALRPGSYIALERHLLHYAKPLHGLGVALVSRCDIGSLLATISASSGGSTASVVIRVLCMVHRPRAHRAEPGDRHACRQNRRGRGCCP